ncbi:MAG: hypothetical protein V4545_00230 [Pseudomonadota bacterium]
MNDKPKSRAEVMAAQYGPKLLEMGVIPAAKEINKIADQQTAEQKTKLKNAVAKLRTFYD